MARHESANEPASDQPRAIEASALMNVVDLRPFREIGCTGAIASVLTFLCDLFDSCRDDAQVFVLDGAFDHLDDADLRLDALARGATAEEIAPLVRDQTTSVLVIALGRHGADLDRLRARLSEKATLRVLYLDSHPEVEALVHLDEQGGRQLFVRPEFAKTPPHPHPSRLAAPVFFERRPNEPHIRHVPLGVGFLGPTAMIGSDYPLARHPKLSELIVYLALHPDGATSRNWTTALWPDRRVPPQTVSNRLSEARRILGLASDGLPRLRRCGERHLLVEFESDWQRFQVLAQSERPDDWKAALSLVRGRPFDDLVQVQWVIFEGFFAEIERVVTTTALALGSAALSEGNADLAVWASQQAIKACPFDERLHRLLMRSADALGNRAGVEATLQTLAMILEIDGDPLRGVHPKTAQLYSALTATSASRA